MVLGHVRSSYPMGGLGSWQQRHGRGVLCSNAVQVRVRGRTSLEVLVVHSRFSLITA